MCDLVPLQCPERELFFAKYSVSKLEFNEKQLPDDKTGRQQDRRARESGGAVRNKDKNPHLTGTLLP
jgi:hypothetical protein